MKFGILSVAAAVALSASTVSAQQPGTGYPPPVIITQPQVIVAPPQVVVAPPLVYPYAGVTVVRPGLGVTIGVGPVFPSYGYSYYPRYYGGHYYHGHHR